VKNAWLAANNPWPALIVAVVLLVTGICLMMSHVRGWRRQQADPRLEEKDRAYYGRRYRRRMQTSAILAVLGVLIGLGDVLLPFQQQPRPVTLYWIGVLLLTLWVMLLAFADFWSALAYGRVELARVRQRRRDLERQIVEFKHRPIEENGPDAAAQ
jgi:hypothetical protein